MVNWEGRLMGHVENVIWRLTVQTLGVLLIALIMERTTARLIAGPTVLPEIHERVQMAL